VTASDVRYPLATPNTNGLTSTHTRVPRRSTPSVRPSLLSLHPRKYCQRSDCHGVGSQSDTRAGASNRSRLKRRLLGRVGTGGRRGRV
jgi:hypothetical protein